MLSRFFSYVTIFSLFVFTSISAQEIGKIFTVEEANEKFGKVIESVGIETSTVQSWINASNDKIMFRLKAKSYTVLVDSRELVYSTSNYFESNEEFHIYSKSKLVELMNKGSKSTTYLENRNDVFSITNGNFTLEYSLPCPPDCG